ncbi:MAG: hypothetical protein JW864_17940 [Spirochaetes bacterium]|nr:hypothetical protein [Spirochaetota bacterium]
MTIKKTRRSGKTKSADETPVCALCGSTENVIITPCCGNFACNPEKDKADSSSLRSNCASNHMFFTLCGYHYNEGHEGRWQDCELCKQSLETEIYVNLGTNDYNFEKLENPPEFKPTKCASCGSIIPLIEGGYSLLGKDYYCARCTAREFEQEMHNKNTD